MNATPEPSSSVPAEKPPRLALLVATGFGLGYLPLAPGTWGSLGGGALVWVLWWIVRRPPPAGVEVFPGPPFLFALAQLWLAPFVYLLAMWAAGRAARFLGGKDPQTIVVDEISGLLLTFVPLSVVLAFAEQAFNWKYLLAGLILFRVFDIWKPWPARAAEKLPGGWGIMADDWVAGVYAAAGLVVIRAAGF